MSLNSLRKDLFSYIQANWTDSIIVFQDQDTNDEIAQGPDPFVYFYLSFSKATDQKTLGKNNVVFVRYGTAAAKIFVRKEAGTGLLFELADKFEAIVRNQKINNTQLKAPNTTIFKNPPPGWIGVSVACPFSSDTQHSI